MRGRKPLRWVARRNKKKASWASKLFDWTDLIMLVLLISLSILVLRISFIYASVSSIHASVDETSDSPFHDFGKSLGLGSAFDLGLLLSGLLFVFWVFVSLSRLADMKNSPALVIWHLFIFSGIGLLAFGCYSAIIF